MPPSNLNDSDWGFSKTNHKGFKLALSYNVNDFTNFNVTYFDTKIIQKGMTFSLGNLDHSQELLVDIVLLADELDQFFVRSEPPVDAHVPGFRIGLRIVDGQVDLDPSIGRPARRVTWEQPSRYLTFSV